MIFIQSMLKVYPTWRMQLVFGALTFLIVSAKGSEQTMKNILLPSTEASLDSSFKLSPEPTFEASTEPSLEPQLPPMDMSTLVDQSYMRHIDFIRQGLPMPLVKSFYDHALKEATSPGCTPAEDNVLLGTCTTPLFDKTDGFAVKSLQEVISQEEGRLLTERYFPDIVPRTDLPSLTEDEDAKISATKTETLQSLSLGATNGWDVSVFPTDEEIRFDPGQNASCKELMGKMHYLGLTMTASSLTAFVLGMAAQLIVIHGNSPQARMILENHAKLMYTAARCNRTSGDNLEVPTHQLRELIRRAKLAQIARSTNISETSLPPFEFMKEVIAGSKHFFAEEIDRMSSLNSFGRINYITWTGDSVSSTKLDNRIADKVTLQTLTDFYEEQAVSSPEPNLPCQSGFTYQNRLAQSEIQGENCCAETCIVGSGRRLDLFIVNEMCCLACNQMNCDLSSLAKVIQVEAFRFTRSG